MVSANKSHTRRNILRSGAGLLLALTAGGALAGPSTKLDPEEGVTAPEDLMKEHGVLNRCLLVYEEGIRRVQADHAVDAEAFRTAAEMVKTFVEQYHEKNEENFIFPEFEKAGVETALVRTLREQHQAGRRVTEEILRLSRPAEFRMRKNREVLIAACRSFIRMYRPHESREDTVLFPALRTILPAKAVEALGGKMEKQEEQVLGKEGFERSVQRIADLEKQLGIYELAQFTPTT